MKTYDSVGSHWNGVDGKGRGQDASAFVGGSRWGRSIRVWTFDVDGETMTTRCVSVMVVTR